MTNLHNINRLVIVHILYLYTSLHTHTHTIK